METTTMTPCQLEDVQLTGRPGAVLERVIEARYRGDRALTAILPQAVEALRERVDDRLVPQRGLWRGEFFGKWILAAIDACRSSGDERLCAAIADAVGQAIATQDADGYIGSYHDSAFGLDDENAFEWNLWGRKYTLWALVAAADFLERDDLTTAAVRMCDHIISQVGPEARSLRNTGNFHGLVSASLLVPVVHLYRHAGHRRHLDYAAWIAGQLDSRIIPGMFQKALDGLPIALWQPQPEEWAKGYEFISCIEGLLELGGIEGHEPLARVAGATFALLRDHERNICGGVGYGDKLLFGAYRAQSVTETCDAVHYQRLATRLLLRSGEAGYAEEVERVFYNHLLGSVTADGAWGQRRRLLAGRHWISPGHCGLEHHHCCVANLPRSLFEVAATAVLQGDDGPVVMLYLPGDYRLPGGERLRIDTDYPADGAIRIACEPGRTTTLGLRLPGWATVEALIIDGRAQEPALTDGIIRLALDGPCTVELRLDMRPRLVALPDRQLGLPQPYRALHYGPLVLARDRRLGADIHGELRLRTRRGPVMCGDAGPIDLRPCPPPEGIWCCFETEDDDGQPLRFCDAASAGNTWDVTTSDFRIWQPNPSDDPAGTRWKLDQP